MSFSLGASPKVVKRRILFAQNGRNFAHERIKSGGCKGFYNAAMILCPEAVVSSKFTISLSPPNSKIDHKTERIQPGA